MTTKLNESSNDVVVGAGDNAGCVEAQPPGRHSMMEVYGKPDHRASFLYLANAFGVNITPVFLISQNLRHIGRYETARGSKFRVFNVAGPLRSTIIGFVRSLVARGPKLGRVRLYSPIHPIPSQLPSLLNIPTVTPCALWLFSAPWVTRRKGRIYF